MPKTNVARIALWGLLMLAAFSIAVLGAVSIFNAGVYADATQTGGQLPPLAVAALVIGGAAAFFLFVRFATALAERHNESDNT